jgi:hypothetical protein
MATTTQQTGVSALTFCRANKEAALEWANKLPVTNLEELSERLGKAVAELSSVELDPAIRIDILEVIRPSVYFACQCLDRQLHNTPIKLPQKYREKVDQAHTLQNNMAAAYTLAAIALLETKENARANCKVAALAIHRAISELTQTLLRTCKIYSPPASGTWQTLHRLYSLANSNQLSNEVVNDEEKGNQSSTILDNYLHTLLLGCINTNQLKQDDIYRYHEALWPWVKRVRLVINSRPLDNFFTIDPDADTKPVHCSKTGIERGDKSFYLDTHKLVSYIRGLSQQEDATEGELSEQLLNHLLVTWKVKCNRDNRRVKLDKKLEVCCGLFSVHYHCANKVLLRKLVSNFCFTPFEEDENPFLSQAEKQRRMRDVWDKAYEASLDGKINGRIVEEELARKRSAAQKQQFSLTAIFHARAVDVSETGYRLEWSGDVPPNFKTGEVVGFREKPGQAWKIAFVRWVRTGINETTYGGIEFIANSADAWGAQLLSTKGNRSKFIRALLLPEDPQTGDLNSILIPTHVSQCGDKIFICQNDQEATIRLTEEKATSALCCRFFYNRTTQLSYLVNEQGNFLQDSEFAGVWDKLQTNI